MGLKVTGVKAVVFAERGKPSKGLVTVIVRPEDVESVVIQNGRLHISLFGYGGDWKNRWVQNAQQFERALLDAGRMDLFRTMK